MKKKGGLLVVLVLILIFGLSVIGCEDDSIDDSYTQADVNVGGLLLCYYFSKTPEGIEKAMFDNGIKTINPPVKNAMWELNHGLDNNVKNAMNSYLIFSNTNISGC